MNHLPNKKTFTLALRMEAEAVTVAHYEKNVLSRSRKDCMDVNELGVAALTG